MGGALMPVRSTTPPKKSHNTQLLCYPTMADAPLVNKSWGQHDKDLQTITGKVGCPHRGAGGDKRQHQCGAAVAIARLMAAAREAKV